MSCGHHCLPNCYFRFFETHWKTEVEAARSAARDRFASKALTSIIHPICFRPRVLSQPASRVILFLFGVLSDIASCHIIYHFLPHPILSYPIAPFPVVSYRGLWCRMPFCSIVSYRVASCLIATSRISSRCLSYRVVSHRSAPIVSQLIVPPSCLIAYRI